MISLRPIGYVVGLLILALGVAMLLPFMVDWWHGDPAADSFAISAFVTVLMGVGLVLTCQDSRTRGLSIQQTFLLTVACWLTLPIFGAIPMWIGPNPVSYTDAFFEAMSGLTTTGSTIYADLDPLSDGIHLWRAMMQWLGGVGIIVFALAFLPMLKVGGMQIFRSEAFDTFGKILPRAAEIAGSIFWIYLSLTIVCALTYGWAGMGLFEAITHAMTTVSTGGFSSENASFGAFEGGAEYIAVVFMILASLPFARYVQLVAGTAQPLFRDTQIHAFLGLLTGAVALLALWQIFENGQASEPAFRKALFNATSIMTGTGYASDDYWLWGAFPVTIIFLIGLIGGCAGSTCCSVKVFRFQLLVAAVGSQVRRLHSPSGIFPPRYEGRPVSEDVMSSVMAFFVMFILTLGAIAIILGLMGLDTVTAVSGAATAIANIGPGLGPEIGPAGNFSGLPDQAKWVLAFAMLIGRLELMSVYVLFTVAFWRG
ncbi:TrkH family potassium uptake protein [Pontivivens insulae]|uniref:Trk system potassium uptake protein n=1 Tax=Pontivivens insulae TaxID=1639689 RepID=A0A2R8ACK1_9RHOB|nr:TrkH family potassium uptake protein [Pontivivens insulae]RED13870.1 trk system potassium uptake protein TrkH [Pontivivens insulae]SPF29944.1 Trk system potassium uptake protein TrkI [Pontivivens insulae]